MKIFSLLSIILITTQSLFAQAGYSSGSFSRAKQFARQGVAPAPPEIVVKEIINYHRHHIPLPDPSPITNETVSLSTQWVKHVNSSSEYYLQVGIATNRLDAESPRPRLNLGFVIDRSGSMRGDKMLKTKEGMKALIRQLRYDDQVSITVFDHQTVVVAPTQQAGNRQQLNRAVDGIFARGSTDLNAGILTGYREVLQNFIPGGTNRLVILTDALLNTGELDPSRIIRNTEYFDADRQIDFAFIGVGMNFNNEIARKIAGDQRNSVHFIHDSDDIRKVFVEEAESLIASVAQHVKLRISIPSTVYITEVYGYDVTPTRRNDRNEISLNLRDLNAGLTQVILLKLRLKFPNRPFLYPRAICDLEYFDVGRQANRHISSKDRGSFFKRTRLKGDVLQLAQPELKKNFSIGDLAIALKRMAELHERGALDEANRLAEKTLRTVEDRYQQRESMDADVRRVYDLLAVYRKDLDLWIADRG